MQLDIRVKPFEPLQSREAYISSAKSNFVAFLVGLIMVGSGNWFVVSETYLGNLFHPDGWQP